ncbi:MAG: hypothetical protein IKV35_06685 [Clostridia bacterium]|nr:hypothetical protein [Clostridia bacterium]
MVNTPIKHDVRDVNRAMRDDPAAFIAAEEARYDRDIAAAANRIADGDNGCRLIWQCGPSSVGKTTTARRLSTALAQRGVQTHIVSLDDFYRGVGKAPLLPDGGYDYESPYALDLERLDRCVTELIETGQTRLPIYDFPAGRPSEETRLLQVRDGAAVIFEGIHAFSPLVTASTEKIGVKPWRLYVNTRSRFTDGDEILLCRRDIRLSRRLLRDERTRASSYENTMMMWSGVLRGDEQYILPHSDTADIVIDTTMAYEPCVLKDLLLSRLHTLDGTAYEETARHFRQSYAAFESISTAYLPENSVLREFVG